MTLRDDFPCCQLLLNTRVHRSGNRYENELPVLKTKRKVRRDIYLPDNIALLMTATLSSKEQIRVEEIWEKMNKNEIIDALNIQCPERNIDSTQPKLNLINEWRRFGYTSIYRLLQSRIDEDMQRRFPDTRQAPPSS